jgi:hypothetical protein
VTARGRDWVFNRVKAREGMGSTLEGGVEERIEDVGRGMMK